MTSPEKILVMIGLVNAPFYLQKRMYGGTVSSAPDMAAAAQEACPPDRRLVK